MTKWNLSLTYEPKIKAVLSGKCRQTIRVGYKIRVGDKVSFHGWEGQPYRSKWNNRTPYFEVIEATLIQVLSSFMIYDPFGIRKIIDWDSEEMDEIARLDGMNPPKGLELKNVLFTEYHVPGCGLEMQIIRWKYDEKEVVLHG